MRAEPATGLDDRGRFRCSSLSLALDEPQFATASTVTRWLLVEQPGPWGRNVPGDSRLPGPVAAELRRRTRELDVRLILIRRAGRSAPRQRHCYLARTDLAQPTLQHRILERVEDVLGVDLEALVAGRAPDQGTLESEPLFLVCTNGRRDPCCAERGRPLAEALARELGERVWECSHIGGDRFAGNLVSFPSGAYFGRVEPGSAVRLTQDFARGMIDLDRYRGRTALSFPGQAAEFLARRHLGLRGLDDLRPVAEQRPARGEGEVEFERPGLPALTVRVRISLSLPLRPLTCHADREATPPSYELVEIREH